MSFDLSNYVDVKTRIELFWAKYPDGSIQTEFMGLVPGRDDMFYCITKVFRHPEDTSPISGMAAELINGKTTFTRNSELMNCESSSVGRALGMLGIGIKTGLASRDEVLLSEARNKGADSEKPAEPLDPWAVIDEPAGIQESPDGLLKFCEHGEMNVRSGISQKTGKPYKAYNCKRGICETQWRN